VYVDLLPPCNHACPAGENIQGWLSLAQQGSYREAWEMLVQDNPLPGVHGRVCYHPCETACNRNTLDSAVSVHAVERFLGDLAAQESWSFRMQAPLTGKRVLVIGAGPSGLSAAYHLRRLGHTVEIHEAGPLPGGMLHFGIPAYRLPRAELLREVGRIEAMGVKLVFNHRVVDAMAEKVLGSFDAVFVAIGAGVAKHLDIPVRDAARVLDAVSLLHDAAAGERPQLGRHVLVYGGGNTAMDAARTAKRLGSEETVILYRRDRAHMPAHAFELNEAIEEGVHVKWLSGIREIIGPEVKVEVMELDQAGHPRPTGRIETLSADAVVLALGQESDCRLLQTIPGIERTPDGSIKVGRDMMTAYPGIFAGGDVVPGVQSVTIAVGHGKRAARHIDAWLRHGVYEPSAKHPVVGFDMLHLPIFSDAKPKSQHVLAPERRTQGFDEVVEGLSEPEARYEAQRCLSCGNCFECDNCYAACPEQAILEQGPGKGYRYDYNRCTGCAVCFEQCPCHAIEMLPEES
jgi:NADPH-dependent glutamate synthase beta subunit-like oxidoreductase